MWDNRLSHQFPAPAITGNTMQAVKFLLVAALAVCAVQAAEIPRSTDRLDFRLIVENGAAATKTIIKAINTGLDQAKPNTDKIINELAPEAQKYVRRIITEIRTLIKEVDQRSNNVFTTLTKALDNLKPIKSCSDKVNPEGKKLFLGLEKDVVNVINAVEKKYAKEIMNVKLGTEKLLAKAKSLFDTQVPAIVKCLTPGKKDAPECLQKEVDKTLKGVGSVITDAVVWVNTARDTLSPISSEILEKALPLLEKFSKAGQGILKTLATCVAGLK